LLGYGIFGCLRFLPFRDLFRKTPEECTPYRSHNIRENNQKTHLKANSKIKTFNIVHSYHKSKTEINKNNKYTVETRVVFLRRVLAAQLGSDTILNEKH